METDQLNLRPDGRGNYLLDLDGRTRSLDRVVVEDPEWPVLVRDALTPQGLWDAAAMLLMARLLRPSGRVVCETCGHFTRGARRRGVCGINGPVSITQSCARWTRAVGD